MFGKLSGVTKLQEGFEGRVGTVAPEHTVLRMVKNAFEDFFPYWCFLFLL